jgi:hypothetical protein
MLTTETFRPEGADKSVAAASGATEPRGRPSFGLLAGRTALAVAVALAVNLVLRAIVIAAVDVEDDFLPLQAGPVATFSIVPMLLAGLWATGLSRLTREARRLFAASAVVLFALSMLPVLALVDPTEPELLGATTGHLVGLTGLHLVPMVTALLLLAPALEPWRLARRRALIR